MLRNLRAIVGHVAWFLSCLPDWIRFQWALRHPRSSQERLLRRLVTANEETEFGRRHGFADIRSPEDFAARVPLADYDDFAAAIARVRRGEPFALAAQMPELLEPTSGSSGATKLIPLTAASRSEFARAVRPWIASLYLAHPRLLLGPHYWAISPNAPVPSDSGDAVRVGFADDADYLGTTGRMLSRWMLAVPSELRLIADPEQFTQLTLLFLLRNRSLRLISVWHPSFLTLLLDGIPRHLPSIVSALQSGRLPDSPGFSPQLRAGMERQFRADPKRARELVAFDLAAHPEHLRLVWPGLELISCWEGPRSEPWLGRLRSLFPNATIQGKGLLATEGCVSVPVGRGRQRPCAIRSHYLEFIDAESQTIRAAWELETGHEYSVILTTGAGLWRYRLHDRVRVTGFVHATPWVEFLGKDNATSDLVGEKLTESHVTEALAVAAAATRLEPRFAMVVPEVRNDLAIGYLLLLELPDGVQQDEDLARRWTELVERELSRNYHYAHARRLGQLQALQWFPVRNGLAVYRACREARGCRSGTVKIPALEASAAVPTAWWIPAGCIKRPDACREREGRDSQRSTN